MPASGPSAAGARRRNGALSEEAGGRKKRKRIFIGAGVTVGVVALIAVGYSAAQPDEEIDAHCVDDSGVVVDDSNCAVPAENTTASGGGGGFAFFPIFIGGGGRQYHYNYGGTGTIGQTVSRRDDHRAEGRYEGAHVVGQFDGHPRWSRCLQELHRQQRGRQ